MNKKLLRILLAVLVVLNILFLSACSPAGADSGGMSAVADKLSSEKVYAYTMTAEIQFMINADEENRFLPQNKNPSERAVWDSRLVKYEFTKNDGDWYGRSEFFETKKDADGQPIYSGKKPEYGTPTVTEYWFLNSLLTVKRDGEICFQGTEDDYFSSVVLPKDRLLLDSAYGNHVDTIFSNDSADAVFSENNRTWFFETIFTNTAYFIDSNGEQTPYKDSPFASGEREDLRFDWESITGVLSNTYSCTQKKNRPTLIEYNTEYFFSNQKTTTQLWNNSETLVWNGDSIRKSAAAFNFRYPDKKTAIKIKDL
ncbi:MAG: hypothetical protein LBT20_00540 [Clostridiales bacterium]|jgi:hypothetical protein|nr:hypothetical protein [Clostridiales bacterium]